MCISLFENYIKEYASLVLLEKQRYARETDQKFNKLEVLEKHKEDPSVLVHFSDLNKLGINPKTSYRTPAGIYGYPLEPLFDNILSGNLPFAADREYLHVFKIVGNIVFIDSNGNTQEDDKWEKLTEKILEPYNETNSDELTEEIIDDARIQTPFGIFWNVTRVISGNNKKWNALLRKCGIDGVIDYGSKIVHRHEPTQGFAVSGGVIQHLGTIIDPYKKEANHKKFIQFEKLKDKILNIIDSDLDDNSLKRVLPESKFESIIKLILTNFGSEFLSRFINSINFESLPFSYLEIALPYIKKHFYDPFNMIFKSLLANEETEKFVEYMFDSSIPDNVRARYVNRLSIKAKLKVFKELIYNEREKHEDYVSKFSSVGDAIFEFMNMGNPHSIEELKELKSYLNSNDNFVKLIDQNIRKLSK